MIIILIIQEILIIYNVSSFHNFKKFSQDISNQLLKIINFIGKKI